MKLVRGENEEAWWRGGAVAWWRGGVVAWWRGGVVGVVAWVAGARTVTACSPHSGSRLAMLSALSAARGSLRYLASSPWQTRYPGSVAARLFDAVGLGQGRVGGGW